MTWELVALLDAHNIPHVMSMYGKLLAQGSYTIDGVSYAEWIEVHGWSKSRLLAWLGY